MMKPHQLSKRSVFGGNKIGKGFHKIIPKPTKHIIVKITAGQRRKLGLLPKVRPISRRENNITLTTGAVMTTTPLMVVINLRIF